ncbi:MAG TPA: hypothetical protein VFR06_08985, partial [Gallionellaceae bacterium]|nr:hypothetical protein [Gallionellaceae bacterium]
MAILATFFKTLLIRFHQQADPFFQGNTRSTRCRFSIVMQRYFEHMRVRATWGLLSLLLGGCAVGPDFVKPDAPKATAYTPQPLPAETAATDATAGGAQKFSAEAALPADWWKLFNSPQLNALVERAIRNSPTIASAQAALRQSQQNV